MEKIVIKREKREPQYENKFSRPRIFVPNFDWFSSHLNLFDKSSDEQVISGQRWSVQSAEVCGV